MNEDDLIARYFRPLAGEGAFALKDDAAALKPPAGELVVTQDALVAGAHFFEEDPPALIAKKLLRVNLSDLAAKGAVPWRYFLTCVLPEVNEAWIRDFARGLKEDQEAFGIQLGGGDTTRGARMFSVTMMGSAPTMIPRSGAMPGDGIYVSGTLGDSALGLHARRQHVRCPAYLSERYLLPEPRLALGKALQGIAHAAMDISDGLMLDLSRLCGASGVGARVELEKLPLSPSAREYLKARPELRPLIYSGGDDYEILFTAPPNVMLQLEEKSGATVTRIGDIIEGKEAMLFDASGSRVTLERLGFQHF